MTLAIAGTLLVLALVDSTSFGTLGIPVVMLVQRAVRVRALLVYLLVLSGFYFVLGLVLLAGAESISNMLRSLDSSATFSWVQLGIGLALVAVSFLFDKRGTAWRKRRREARGLPPKEGRMAGLKKQILGPEATLGAVAGVALVAGLIEAASMVPYLGAIGMLTAADLGHEVQNAAFKPVLLDGVEMKDSAYDAVQGADAVVIVTEWDQFRALDLDRIKLLMNQPVLVDLRNVYRPEDMAKRGFRYTSVGRPSVDGPA